MLSTCLQGFHGSVVPTVKKMNSSRAAQLLDGKIIIIFTIFNMIIHQIWKTAFLDLFKKNFLIVDFRDAFIISTSTWVDMHMVDWH